VVRPVFASVQPRRNGSRCCKSSNDSSTIPSPPSAHSPHQVSKNAAARPSADAIAAKNGRWERKAIGVELLALGGVILVIAPNFAVLALIAGGVGVAQLAKQPSNNQQFVRRYKEIETQSLQSRVDWNRSVAPARVLSRC
jgi:hypothetical protein